MPNFDILRRDGLVNGTQKSAVGTFIASLVIPGLPLVIFLPLLDILTHFKIDGSADLLRRRTRSLFVRQHDF